MSYFINRLNSETENEASRKIFRRSFRLTVL